MPTTLPCQKPHSNRLIRKWMKRLSGTAERSFRQPKPLFFPRDKVAVGKIPCKDCSQPHLASKCEWRNPCHLRVLQNPCPSFHKQDTQQGRCLWGWGRLEWTEAATFLQRRKQPAHQACLSPQPDRQEIHLNCVGATVQGGIIYYSQCSPLRLTSIFTTKKDDPTLGSWAYFPGDNSWYVVKFVAL